MTFLEASPAIKMIAIKVVSRGNCVFIRLLFRPDRDACIENLRGLFTVNRGWK
jgi:hypothetical protein